MKKVKLEKIEIMEEKKAMQEENLIPTIETQDNNLLKYLSAVNMENEIALIFTNAEHTHNFSAGIVSEVFQNEILINHYLPNGKYDGYIVKQISDIIKIETKSKYVKKIKILCEVNTAKHDKLCKIKENGFITLLTYAHDVQKIVSIELVNSGNSDAVGFVQQIDQKCCTISMLDEYGENDGVAVFDIEDISHLSCDGEDEIVLKQLHDAVNNSVKS